MMFQPRTLSRDETLFRYPADNESNLVVHAGEWYRIQPQYGNENWRVDSLSLMLAGPALLSTFQGFGGDAGMLQIGTEVNDSFATIRDTTAHIWNTTESAGEWNAGTFAGTILDMNAGRNAQGNPRAGVRGDVRQASQGTVTWTSPIIPLRYGASISGAMWEADLVRDDAGVVIGGDRIILEGRSGGVWNTILIAQTAAELDAGSQNPAAPYACDAYRVTLELNFRELGQAAHRADAHLRTSAFFLIGVWIALDTPLYSIKSLADLTLRSESNRDFRAGGFAGNWDLCLLRLDMPVELAGRSGEFLKAKIVQPGAALKFLEIQANAGAWFDEA